MLSFFKNSCLFSGALVLAIMGTQAHAAADLYLQDTATDTGVEPYPGSGPMYLSPDIWVRHAPDPNYDPYPFPTATPAWRGTGCSCADNTISCMA